MQTSYSVSSWYSGLLAYGVVGLEIKDRKITDFRKLCNVKGGFKIQMHIQASFGGFVKMSFQSLVCSFGL